MLTRNARKWRPVTQQHLSFPLWAQPQRRMAAVWSFRCWVFFWQQKLTASSYSTSPRSTSIYITHSQQCRSLAGCWFCHEHTNITAELRQWHITVCWSMLAELKRWSLASQQKTMWWLHQPQIATAHRGKNCLLAWIASRRLRAHIKNNQ